MERADISRLGGRARAAKLTPERRKEIAALGFAAMVAKRFGGDKARAVEWLIAKGQAAQDPCPWNGVYPDPGPMPGAEIDES